MAVLTTLAPGAAVGKYLVVREIGRGGMGVVYLAEDTTLSREVALKLLYPSLSTDTVFVDRFKQEARVVAAILHPNIVRINSFETLPEGLAIDMEYVSGPSLGHMMAHEVFTPQLAVQIARDVLEGLAVCHELGVVHRDIKPNNILFAPDGRAKLADFGLATAYATHLESSIYRMSSSGFFMGTPRFAPPEAWEGGHPHPNWDLYSLGLVMYEGLIGRPVYTGTTPLAIVKQLTSGAIGPLRDVAPTVSPELGAFVDRLVSHDQSTRPVDAPAALLELRALPEFDNSNGVGPPTVQMAVRNVRRKSTALRWARKTRTGIFRAAAVAAVAASGAAAFWLTWGTSTAPAPDASAPPARVLASQEELAENNLLTAGEVLSAPRTIASKSARIYKASYITPGDASAAPQRIERWMMLDSPGGGPRRVIGMSDRLLMSAELTDAPGGVSLKGNWAQYGLPFGGGFQEGTVEGSGAWMAPETALSISLRLVNVRDHSERSFGVAVSLDTEFTTDSRFLYELEEAPLLQPLLFVELASRNSGWAGTVMDLLPCVRESTCIAPILADNQSITADGKLDEPVWGRSFFNTAGRIGDMPGRPLNAGARFRAVVDGTDVVIALTYPKPIDGRWGVRFALMPLLAGPVGQQTYMKIVRYRGAPLEYHQYHGGVETNWVGAQWHLEVANGAGGATCELVIPLASLKQSARPSGFSTWRVNAWLVAGPDGKHETTLAAWGFPDLTAIEHGALLRFEAHVS